MKTNDARELVRCPWVGNDSEMIRYHDEEWGVPTHEERHLFEMLTLEGAQAGLSWRTILHKRSGYRAAFADFDAAKVARFDARKAEALLCDPRIVRNRLKVESTISNARALLDLQREEGSLDRFVWSFVGHEPKVNRPPTMGAIATRTPESDALSKALKKRGFRFVGTTIIYAFMQACGLVDDHVATCFRAGSRARK